MTFEQLLLDVINEEFSLLGENCKQSIFFQIEKNTGISKSEIPVRTKDFAEAIEKILGEGAKILQIRIMMNLFNKIGYINPRFYNCSTLDFTEYVEAARKSSTFLFRSRGYYLVETH